MVNNDQYKIRPEFFAIIKAQNKKYLRNNLFKISLFVFFILKAFYQIGFTGSVEVGVGLFIVFQLISIYSPYGLFRRWRILNRTIVDIKIEESKICFITHDFRFLQFFKIETPPVEFTKSGITFEVFFYPLNKLFNFPGKTLFIKRKSVEYYILTRYFEVDIEEKIKDFISH